MSAPLPEGARVLLVRLSALGDVLFALEAVASLCGERPDVRIDFLVEDRFQALLARHPQIETTLVYPRQALHRLPAFLLGLRRRQYDAVLDLQGNMKSAFQVAAARSPRKVGYTAPGAREGSHLVYHRTVALPDPLPHRADCGYHLLRALGLRGERAAPVLARPERSIEFWRTGEGPRVVLHPGTSAFAEFKRWPAERFAALAERLAARGIAVAVSHGPCEAALAAAVAGPALGARTLDGSALGLLGLAAVFADSDLVVAADTGPLHVAAAAGTRVVALFGPKDHGRYGPRGPGHEVLFHEVPCRPCTRRQCPSPQCILGLGVDEVEAAVLSSLETVAT